ncbi:MAG TPA: hypothetical protein DCL61_13825 [Cyanobacteria bacterium UBA12227]|nr:hypothetical protein [Cyanobacteria bacterium UBA12227]HAX88978.1 hypothetical protein [Cyanobacteria bacterium UBA11370]HBY79326.1 hypothetical protein [Cyanobacteria bacterium UBA11148]
MKPELQRIETALDQLAHEDSTDSPKASTAVADSADSWEEGSQPHQTMREPSFSIAVQPFPANKHAGKTPSLPKFKPAKLSEHRHSANPALAMSLLKEIQEIVGSWQKELQAIVRQIQDIYMAGPIVDGWLESHARQPEEAMAGVRHADVDRLMDYVTELLDQSDTNVTCESPRTGYRLCGLDGDGQFWARPCPADQVPSVSLAIARHQKLRQLLSRKQDLETRLSQLAETLVVLHSHLGKN